MKEFELLELSNGLKVVHKEVSHSKIVHCGFVLDIGSRDELDHENGLAHFWEHMAFKGTSTRKAFHVINRLESVGGELNAFTTKEKIYFYASVLSEHFERALELLVDIVFNSTFPEKEIEKEKGVIIEEIAMYEGAPEELIADEFDNLVFENHPLGKYILGTRESVNSFEQKHFKDFIARNLDLKRVVFTSVGNVSQAKFQKLVHKHLDKLSSTTSKRVYVQDNVISKPQLVEAYKHMQQAHCMMGTRAYELSNDKRLPCFIMSNILGGPAMTSRLNMNLREKKGLVYNIETSYAPFSDTGLFSIYFGTDQSNFKKAKRAITSELNKIKTVKLGDRQLSNLKKQLIGQFAMAEESNVAMMQMMGNSLLDFNKIETVDEVLANIESVSADAIMEVANEILDEDKFTTLQYLPEN